MLDGKRWHVFCFFILLSDSIRRKKEEEKMNANIGNDGTEDLFDFDSVEKINIRCAGASYVHVGEDVFEEFKVKMVMRIWNVSRDDARRYIARRSKEAAAIRRKHQERLRKLHNVPEFLD